MVSPSVSQLTGDAWIRVLSLGWPRGLGVPWHPATDQRKGGRARRLGSGRAGRWSRTFQGISPPVPVSGSQSVLSACPCRRNWRRKSSPGPGIWPVSATP